MRLPTFLFVLFPGCWLSGYVCSLLLTLVLFMTVVKEGYSQSQDEPLTGQQIRQYLSRATNYCFSQPDSARYYCQQVIRLAPKNGKLRDRAEAFRIMSIAYEGQGKYSEALEYGLYALALRRREGDSLQVAHTLNSVGIIYDQQGDFGAALACYNEAYLIYKRLKDREHLAMMNINLGILFKSLGQYDLVLRHYRDAYALYLALQLSEETAFCEANLGSVFYYTGQFDSCIYYSLRAEWALLSQNNLQFMPVAQANAGIGFLALGQMIRAKVYLEKALLAHRQYGNRKEMSFVLVHLARLYQQQKQGEKAAVLLREAKALALAIGAPQQVMDASKLLSAHYANQSEYQKAYSEYINYSTVKDTLFEQQKLREITRHQVRYDTERKEQEIALLWQRNRIHELGIRQRNLYLFIAVLLLIALTIVAWLLYRAKKNREEKIKKEAALQAELLRLEAQSLLQDDRLRISRDLHDNIGAHLTFIHTSIASMTPGNAGWQNVQELVNDTISELRRTVWLMNKPSVSIEEWIIRLRAHYCKMEVIEVKVDNLTGKGGHMLSSRQATGLFRIVQEAVNNSLKYAIANRISIAVACNEAGMSIQVEDDGAGFLTDKAFHGFGLENMRHHAVEANGTLSIESTPGMGTRISVLIRFENTKYCV